MKRKFNRLLIFLFGIVLATALTACSFEELQEMSKTLVPMEEIEPVDIVTDPPPAEAYQTAVELGQVNIPQRDLVALSQRLRGLTDVPVVVHEAPFPYELGHEESFWVTNEDTHENFEVTAVLQYITPHLYIWVEQGTEVDLEALKLSADRFENQTYPTNRRLFGSEWSPGVDSDIHLNILHVRNLGSGVGGYYSSADEFSQLAHEYSNEREMFYVNLDGVSQGGDYYDGLLAHEFQHMIHWHADRNEQIWLSEGLSELAAHQNGFDPGLGDMPYLSMPDLQLNYFDYFENGRAHYSKAYLFCLYFLERFGEEATRALVANPINGIAGFDAVLGQYGAGESFESVYGDWVAALYLEDPTLEDGRYGYQSIDFRQPTLMADLPAGLTETTQANVHQFATDYIRVSGSNSVTLVFTGTRQVSLIDTQAQDGDYFWWSNQEDESDTTLTRAFDLSSLISVTLDYWLWYDIETDWDFAYLEVSTNGGQTWDIIQTPHTSDHDPTGNSFGFAYTGMSGSGESPEWIHEQVDLSAYAGRQVLVRFEYITDDAFTRAGLALDNLSIPQLNYTDSFESEDPHWEAAGFMRHNNTIPQEFLIQLILPDQLPPVQKLELGADGTGRWILPLGAETDEVILTISGISRVTRQTAGYAYRLEGE